MLWYDTSADGNLILQIGKMYTQTTQMDPLFPSYSDKLSDLAISIIRDSATLGGQLHPITRATIINLLRIINSYYSNRIEGHCCRRRVVGRRRRCFTRRRRGYHFDF